MHRYIFTIVKDSEKASDLTQDTFLKFFDYSKKNYSINNPRAYLFRMAHNMAMDFLKKPTTLSLNVSAETDNLHVDHINKQEEIIDRERAAQRKIIFDKALDELSPQAKTVFEKSRLEGKKYREISEDMGIAEKTVEAHMTKALKIIREFIRVNAGKISLLVIATILYATH